MKLIKYFRMCIVLLVFVSLGAVADSRHRQGPNPPPAGYESMMVLIADGTLDPFEPHPEIPGCFFGNCDGSYFDTEVLGLTAEEQQERLEQAEQFFSDRFGIDDISALESQGRAVLLHVTADPRTRYRVVAMSGRRIDEDGVPIKDGLYSLVVLDPDGLELGGEFLGITAPQFSQMVWGTYVIDFENGPRHSRRIRLDYQSSAPVELPNLDGTSTFRCQIPDHPRLGPGQANGISGPTQNPDGTMTFFIRNVITFPPTGGVE